MKLIKLKKNYKLTLTYFHVIKNIKIKIQLENLEQIMIEH